MKNSFGRPGLLRTEGSGDPEVQFALNQSLTVALHDEHRRKRVRSAWRMFAQSCQASDGKFLLALFWRSASGYWRGKLVWMLVTLLIAVIVLQLLVQYWINFWNRDFFNALEQKDPAALWRQAQLFVLLTAMSVVLAIMSVWGRMTVQRQWREWLSRHLIARWLSNAAYWRLRLVSGAHRCPEYRIAEDARFATDAPIDLSLGLLTAVLNAV